MRLTQEELEDIIKLWASDYSDPVSDFVLRALILRIKDAESMKHIPKYVRDTD